MKENQILKLDMNPSLKYTHLHRRRGVGYICLSMSSSMFAATIKVQLLGEELTFETQ